MKTSRISLSWLVVHRCWLHVYLSIRSRLAVRITSVGGGKAVDSACLATHVSIFNVRSLEERELSAMTTIIRHHLAAHLDIHASQMLLSRDHLGRVGSSSLFFRLSKKEHREQQASLVELLFALISVSVERHWPNVTNKSSSIRIHSAGEHWCKQARRHANHSNANIQNSSRSNHSRRVWSFQTHYLRETCFIHVSMIIVVLGLFWVCRPIRELSITDQLFFWQWQESITRTHASTCVFSRSSFEFQLYTCHLPYVLITHWTRYRSLTVEFQAS